MTASQVRWPDDINPSRGSTLVKDARVAAVRWGPDGRFRAMAARDYDGSGNFDIIFALRAPRAVTVCGDRVLCPVNV